MNDEKSIISLLEGVVSEVQKIKESQTSIDTLLGHITNRLGMVENQLVNTNAWSNEINTGVEQIRQTQTRLEFTHSEKLAALFDGRSIIREYLESLKDGQARIEDDLDDICTKLGNLEVTQFKQEREIRLLRIGKQK